MFSIRSIIRTSVLTAVTAAALFATGTPARADLPPLQLSSNIHCNSLTDVVTFFNNTATDVVANAVLQSSLQNSSLTATVPANGAANVTFNLTIGERLDKIILRDANLAVVFTTFPDIVITGTGECTRPAVDLVELVGYSLTCNNGVTHAAVTIQNNGDYAANIDATGSYWFATEAERDAADQLGLISVDNETFSLAPGFDSSFGLDFEVVDALLVTITNKGANVFTDGPRSPSAGEGCAAAAPVETTVPATVPDETTPPTVPPTTPDTTPDTTQPTPNGVADPILDTTSATSTTLAAAQLAPAAEAPRALPVTGRSSLPMGLIGAVLLSLGLALVRTTRRRSA
jgi:hypothetical protein